MYPKQTTPFPEVVCLNSQLTNNVFNATQDVAAIFPQL